MPLPMSQRKKANSCRPPCPQRHLPTDEQDREVAGLNAHVARDRGIQPCGRAPGRARHVMLILLLVATGDGRIRHEHSGAFQVRQTHSPGIPLTKKLSQCQPSSVEIGRSVRKRSPALDDMCRLPEKNV